MRPIIGNSKVVLYINRVCSIEAVGIILDVISRHLRLFIACTAEELVLLRIVDARGIGRKEGPR